MKMMNWEAELRKAERKRLEEIKYAALREQARQGVPSYSNPQVYSGVNPLQQSFQPVTDRPWYGDNNNPLNLLNVEDERLMDMIDSGILQSDDYFNLRENAERWKAQDAEALNLKAERTTNDFGQILPQADFYGNQLTPSARVDLYQDQTDRTNALLNQKEFSYMDDISEPNVVGGILDQHADRNEADNPSSIWSDAYNSLNSIYDEYSPQLDSIWNNVPNIPTDAFDAGEYVLNNYAQPVNNFFGDAFQGISDAYSEAFPVDEPYTPIEALTYDSMADTASGIWGDFTGWLSGDDEIKAAEAEKAELDKYLKDAEYRYVNIHGAVWDEAAIKEVIAQFHRDKRYDER